MIELANPRLAAWESFYVIIGSSGAVLIGLQFVVMTLSNLRQRGSLDSINAFGTPTVVHLSVALAISAVMSAPWPSLGLASFLLFVIGLAGLAYGALQVRRARRQTTYQPVREDWAWYVTLPIVVYAVLALGALLLRPTRHAGQFMIGAAALALLLISVRNAWDTVIHMVMVGFGDEPPKAE